eukprot:scaffold6270_cov162-Amphora_coffeaeformis.AAC.2
MDEAEEVKTTIRAAFFSTAQGLLCDKSPKYWCISKQFGIHYCDFIYIREGLGAKLTRMLLVGCGLMFKGLYDGGYQDVAPCEIDFVCPGTPVTFKRPAKPCTGHDDEYVSWSGARSKDHVFYGYFACQGCSNDIDTRELDVLEYMKEPDMELTHAQTKCLQYLQGYKETNYCSQKKQIGTTCLGCSWSSKKKVDQRTPLDCPRVLSTVILASGLPW